MTARDRPPSRVVVKAMERSSGDHSGAVGRKPSRSHHSRHSRFDIGDDDLRKSAASSPQSQGSASRTTRRRPRPPSRGISRKRALVDAGRRRRPHTGASDRAPPASRTRRDCRPATGSPPSHRHRAEGSSGPIHLRHRSPGARHVWRRSAAHSGRAGIGSAHPRCKRHRAPPGGAGRRDPPCPRVEPSMASARRPRIRRRSRARRPIRLASLTRAARARGRSAA